MFGEVLVELQEIGSSEEIETREDLQETTVAITAQIHPGVEPKVASDIYTIVRFI